MNDQSQPSPPPEPGAAPIPSSLDFPVVGIGASAGGLQALLRFFEQMPAQSGMAFVIILHLSPRHESNVASILQNATRLRVTQVNSPTPIEKNNVYVISPSKDLTMVDGYLRVDEARRPKGRHVAIDLFFRTLADAHRHRAFAIVLSGTGSDGAVGLARVKEFGGVTMAQLPDDAEYDGMPRSAIATNAVDVVLPVADMPQKLLALWDNASRIEMPEPGDDGTPAHVPPTPERSRAAEDALHDVIAMLRNRTGHDFRHYKRATVLRRLERRMQVNAVPDLGAYRELLQSNLNETPALLRDMLIGVTNFFRDRESFEAIERDIVPLLFEDKPAGEQVRAWAAGCSTGEEAYSIAMLLCEYADTLSQPPGVQVFATDIDDTAIGAGRAGSYPESIITDVTPARLRQFFTKEGAYYRVKKPLRDHVLFAAHNVLRDPPFSRLDLVSCRNLLIYLDREVQAEVLEMFRFALRPGGFLFLGSSESADSAAKYFEPVDKKNRIFRAKPVSRSSRYAATLPLGTKLRPLGGNLSMPRAPERRRSSFAEMHQRVLEQYAPPSVIIDYESNIIHMSDRAGRFLRYIGGEPSHNLVALVYPELRLELRTALYQAMQTSKSVEARRTRIEREGRTFYVNMTARPFRDPDGGAEFVLVLFDEVEDTLSHESKTVAGEDSMLAQLESELQRTKDQLQTTIEHAETSTEELKASNEELQAINEELRSATEELETSKEELQSINEELITVNHELKMKVEETGKINDDLQNLIASTDIATIFVDSALRIKRYTPRAVDIFSIIPSDVGRSLLDITHRLDYAKLADDVAETFTSLRMIEREVTGNDERWYIARLLPYRTTEDRIEGAVLTFIDITGRRRAEERLRAGEERVSFVLESTKDYAIITMDPSGLVTTWNKGAERMFGYTEEEMLGVPGSIIFTPEDLAAGAHIEEMRRAREDGRAEDERWHMHRDGTRLFCSGVMTPLSHGAVRGYAKIARDVTGGKRAENERETQLQAQREMSAKAQAANQLKDEFLAIMSHELKHPLNLIHVNAEILSRLPAVQTTGTAVRATETIQRAVMGQAKIIDDLLDFSRVHTGKLALRRTAVDVVRVLEAIVEALRRDGEESGVAVRLECTDEPLWIHADAVRVEQIIWNLASNALKFTPRGGTVVLSLRAEDGMARVDVVDNGMGIVPESLPHIFDMFAQSTAAKLAGKAGLGIGLALVKELTALHGGSVEASSEGPGRGARFTVWLPLDAPAAMPAKEAPTQGVLQGVRVLLVDDTEDTLEAFGDLLAIEGAVVTTASNAYKALEIARGEDFDVVLSDIGMPDMDGCQFLETLRREPRGATVPAVALTGYGRPNDVRRVMEAGFNAHISKPVTLSELLSVLQGIGVGAAPVRTAE
ncbi:PAS domain S-box protein [Cupriavidus respiraculi]|uniref:CheR family methyltransferase n=1 Tax=Cupriavidus respiraculi TaxID=195930 RepID=UPI001C93A065|nr:CheR family methyltransferase [Cupriavidus respiraculi]MBY4946600.1 PAS domain S-box protein [Cupriavidus respiraculi]